jgi:hypothetical protein
MVNDRSEMRRLLVLALSLMVFAAGGLLALRKTDEQAERSLWTQIEARAPQAPMRYSAALVEDMPEIARRYFNRTFAPGARMTPVVTLEQEGRFLVPGRELTFANALVIDAPAGAFLRLQVIDEGFPAIRGSDAMYRSAGPFAQDGPLASWARYWHHGIVPYSRLRGPGDHTRSAATVGIVGGLYAPAALLPQAGAVWRQVGPDQAEIRYPDLPGTSPLRLTLDRSGLVTQVATLAWSNVNPERQYRLQPFGGRIIAHGTFEGVTIPVEAEFGHDWGTAQYQPLYTVRITSYRALWRE